MEDEDSFVVVVVVVAVVPFMISLLSSPIEVNSAASVFLFLSSLFPLLFLFSILLLLLLLLLFSSTFFCWCTLSLSLGPSKEGVGGDNDNGRCTTNFTSKLPSLCSVRDRSKPFSMIHS